MQSNPEDNFVGHPLIVIGASAGGLQPLSAVVSSFPSHLRAAVLIVLHIPADRKSRLDEILQRNARVKVRRARDGEVIETGTVYVARPDRHLVVQDGSLRVVFTARENRHRPAIDPLFRSAAYYYGPKAVAVVLSGVLDDGASGALSVKQRGGIVIVQDPNDALFSEMPRSVERVVDVDYRLPASKIGPCILRLTEETAKDAGEFVIPDLLKKEVKMVENK